MKKSIKNLLTFLFITLNSTLPLNSQSHRRPPIEIKQLNDHIWLLNDNYETTSYVVVGKKKALVIDTMYGYENVCDVVRKITNLPLIIINTHGHIDHIYGNGHFKQEILINKKDYKLAKLQYSYKEYLPLKMHFNFSPIEFSFIKEGDIIDLGELSLEVIEFPGHTKGGILLLDRKDKILFTGDSINRHNWMQLPESLSFKKLISSLEKIAPLRPEYDFILHNHAQDFEPATLYEEYFEAVKEVHNGNTQNDQPYQYFGGTCKQHKYTKGDITIVYN